MQKKTKQRMGCSAREIVHLTETDLITKEEWNGLGGGPTEATEMKGRQSIGGLWDKSIGVCLY